MEFGDHDSPVSAPDDTSPLHRITSASFLFYRAQLQSMKISRSLSATPLRLLVVFLLTACGDDAPPPNDAAADVRSDTSTGTDTGPSCGTSASEVPCDFAPSGTCPVGHYCNAEMLTCSLGCITDDSCPPSDYCRRSGSIGECTPCSTCGDGECQASETESSCPTDCAAPRCGDGTCEPSETPATCPTDCPNVSCGNGTCEPSESSTSCPEDCPAVRCGDGACDATEGPESCPADCDRTPFQRCVETCEQTGMCGIDAGMVSSCRATCGGSPVEDQEAIAACRDENCTRMANCLGLECFTDAECAAGTCGNSFCCGNGVCTDLYESAETCPADCASDYLVECLEECDGFAFFGCGTGCSEECRESSPGNRERFIECSNPAACNFEDCRSLL